jgi:tetratricopeptide (TPR) repeat protein
MIRLLSFLLLCCGAYFSSARASEPTKPQWQRKLTGDDARVASKLEQQINELLSMDDFKAAATAGEELLALRTRVQGKDHHECVTLEYQISTMRKVAELPAEKRKQWSRTLAAGIEARRMEAQGRYSDALLFRRAILKWNQDVLGEDHPDTALGYNNLAVNLHQQGRDAEAQELFRKALDIRRRVLGENHPHTATSYNNVASNLGSLQGRYEEARALFQKALDIHRRVDGEDHPATADSLNNVASSLGNLGRHAEGQPLHKRALDIRIATLGEDHPRTALGYNNLAANLAAQGRYLEAGPLCQKALTVRRKVLGEDHPDTGDSFRSVAAQLFEQGRYAEAQPLFQKALDIHRTALGEDHPRTAESYTTLALNLQAQDRHSSAQPLFQKALDILHREPRAEHPKAARAYSNLAANLDAQGKYTEALPLHQKALDIHRKILGNEHPDTTLYYVQMAVHLLVQGRNAEANPLLEKAVEMRLGAHGQNHHITAESFTHLAFNLVAQGKRTEAVPVLEKAVLSFEASRSVGVTVSGLASIENFGPELQTFSSRLLLACLLQGKEPERAWREVEMSLARGLLDLTAMSQAPALNPEERMEQTKQLDRVAALQPRILSLVTKPERTEAESADLQRMLTERREAEGHLAELAAKASRRQVASAQAIRAAIPPDAALLFWVDVTSDVAGVQEHWVCVVRSTGDPRWERLPGTGANGTWIPKEDGLLISRFINAIKQSAPKPELDELTKRFRSQRIVPALPHLDGVKSLYVVPAHWLAGVPVELLAPEFTVSYVPSGTFLARAKDRPSPAGRRALALGDPIFKRPGNASSAADKPLPPGGLLIMQVVPEGAAAKAGLKRGDVILKYGDAEVNDTNSLGAAVAARARAGSVPVTIWRETAQRPVIRDVAVGKLGVVLAREPAPMAMGAIRRADAQLQSLQGGEWADLPGSRVELDRLRQLLGDDCLALSDSDASEQRLEELRKSGELSKYRYIHLGTHGEGNTAAAFESALILAQDHLPQSVTPVAGEPTLDGRLLAREVLEFWKLDAELVTLSACETAFGKPGAGEGKLGFAQAFLAAGSRSMCLSQWKVDDVATALLMDRFYQNLLLKRMGKAAALHEAKRWLRELSSDEALQLTAKLNKGVGRGTRSKGEVLNLGPPAGKDSKPFAHPRYWAAFVLIGDPN